VRHDSTSPWFASSPGMNADGEVLPPVNDAELRSLVNDFAGIVPEVDVRSFLTACENNIATCRVTLLDLYAPELTSRKEQQEQMKQQQQQQQQEQESGGSSSQVPSSGATTKPTRAGNRWEKVKPKPPRERRPDPPVPGMPGYAAYANEQARLGLRPGESHMRGLTAADADKVYADSRNSARQYALLRKVAFENASRAFARGHHSEGRRLIAQGKDFGRQMALAHEEAGRLIFAAHNGLVEGYTRGGGGGGGGNSSGGSTVPSSLASSAGGSVSASSLLAASSASSQGASVPMHTGIPSTRTLDLHGLHVSEALQAVETALVLAKREKDGVNDMLVTIITGRGKHSEGGARIKPAVINLLDSRGTRYSLANEGCIVVRMR
jgi:hypothetical protein